MARVIIKITFEKKKEYFKINIYSYDQRQILDDKKKYL